MLQKSNHIKVKSKQRNNNVKCTFQVPHRKNKKLLTNIKVMEIQITIRYEQIHTSSVKAHNILHINL